MKVSTTYKFSTFSLFTDSMLLSMSLSYSSLLAVATFYLAVTILLNKSCGIPASSAIWITKIPQCSANFSTLSRYLVLRRLGLWAWTVIFSSIQHSHCQLVCHLPVFLICCPWWYLNKGSMLSSLNIGLWLGYMSVIVAVVLPHGSSQTKISLQ